jgi:glycosyltransferase involved in cell wall biosynthesis
MRILVANKFYWPKGGSERVMFDLNRGYEGAGHEVVPFSMRSARNLPTPWERHFVSEVDYARVRGPIAKLGVAGRTIWSREAASRIRALVRESRPHAAHLHNIHHQLSPSIVDVLREEGIPTVHTLHDYKLLCPSYLFYTEGAICERCKGGRFHEAVIHRCVQGSIAASAVAAAEMTFHRARRTLERGVRVFVAPSRFLADKLAEFGMDPGRVRIVPNGVDASSMAPAERPGESFVFAGRLSPEKGLGVLIDALALAPDVRLQVAGEGPQGGTLAERARRTAPGRAEWLGPCARELVLARIRGARALVLPSLVYENAPLAALEAAALGVPVIGSRLGGIPEIVRDGETGLLVPENDPIALAEAMIRLWRDPALAARLGRRAREVACAEYALDLQIERMLAILEEVASSGSR